MIDQLFVILSVLIAFLAWEKKVYFPIAMILVADFVFFFGFQEIWTKTDYITLKEDMVFRLEGAVYFVFFYLYLITNSKYLATLSVLAAFYHLCIPSLGDGGYEQIMTVYCILQLLGALAGVYSDIIHRHYPDLFSPFDHLFNFKNHHKGSK